MSAVATTPMPEDLAAYIASLDSADCRASEILQPLTDEQTNWQPHGGGAWSIAQCLDHMAVTNRSYLAPLEEAAKRAKTGHRPLATGGWLSRYFLRKTEPPVSIKIKAPDKIKPSKMISKADALARLRASNGAIREFVRKTASLDLCETRFKNPFVPILMNFTIASGLLIIAAHNRRHLWQAEQVIKEASFPQQ